MAAVPAVAVNGVRVGISSQAYLESKAVKETKVLISDLCRQFYNLGWVSGTGGSITIKVHDDSIPKPQQLVIMSPSGACSSICLSFSFGFWVIRIPAQFCLFFVFLSVLFPGNMLFKLNTHGCFWILWFQMEYLFKLQLAVYVLIGFIYLRVFGIYAHFFYCVFFNCLAVFVYFLIIVYMRVCVLYLFHFSRHVLFNSVLCVTLRSLISGYLLLLCLVSVSTLFGAG